MRLLVLDFLAHQSDMSLLIVRAWHLVTVRLLHRKIRNGPFRWPICLIHCSGSTMKMQLWHKSSDRTSLPALSGLTSPTDVELSRVPEHQFSRLPS